MCGLTGGWWSDPNYEIESRVQTSIEKLNSRGPNDSGYKLISVGAIKLALGHTRLSIIDLSSDGHQPMHSDDGRYSLVFNGEIYNYLELKDELESLGEFFYTKSDSEVLLKSWIRWGDDCLLKLDGMFAFVIFDNLDKMLYCARDPFGIKPFYYEITKEKFIFSSELPALIQLRDEETKPNLQRAYDYLIYSDYDSNDETFIKGINQLKPAQLLSMKVGESKSVKVVTYWDPEKIQPKQISFQDAANQVRESFLTNIKRQLRSDVPLGVALSGGIDSSAIVCAIRKIEPDIEINTFSYISDDEKLSEESWVNIVNDHVNANSYKIRATGAELESDLTEMIMAQGEPFGSTSIYAQYRVFQLAKFSGITVTLDGQGADELLAGYQGYPGQRLKSFVDKYQLIEAYKFAKNWAQWPNRSIILALKSLGQTMLPDFLYGFFRKLSGCPSSPAWINSDYLKKNQVNMSENRLRPKIVQKGARVTECLKLSLGKRNLPALLRHADRNAMHFSIESRVPFLSIHLAELLLSLPDEYLISNEGETKSIFRAAMRGIVPDEILDRKDKIGFATPEKDWLLGMHPLLKSWLEISENILFLNKTELIFELDKIISDKKAFSWQVWRWVNYCQWYCLFITEKN